MATRLKSGFMSMPSGPHETAYVYDAVGAGYRRYGYGTDSFDFGGDRHFADRETWARIDGELVAFRAAGRERLRVLDAGCGAGGWLIRIAGRARELGFTQVEGIGFDISPEMIVLASTAALHVVDSDIALHFSVTNIEDALEPLAADSFDITLCLNGVLNHLPVHFQDDVAAHLARVTGTVLLITVRAAGSLPTIYVDSLDRARAFHQDNVRDRLEVDLVDGRHFGFGSHLFHAEELRRLFAGHIDIAEVAGLDIFHSRFAPNPHWNPGNIPTAGFDPALEELERRYASDSAFIDRAANILLIGAKAGAA